MDLELRDLIPVVVAELGRAGWVGAGGVDLSRAEVFLRELRREARETFREFSARECVESVLSRMGGMAPPKDILEHVLARVYEGLLPAVVWHPEALPLLHELSQAGLRLGLVSNAAYGPFVRKALEAAGVAGVFGAVVVSAENGWRKPHPAPFMEALDRLGVEPGEACHVGDHYPQDVAGALGVGVSAIWIRVEEEAPVHLPGEEAVMAAAGDSTGVIRVSDLGEVRPLLRGWVRSGCTPGRARSSVRGRGD